MSSLFTQCPQCQTVFPLDIATLCQARGQVRCGRCGAVFAALDALSGERPSQDRIQMAPAADYPPTLMEEAPDTEPADEDPPIEAELFPHLPPASVTYTGLELEAEQPGRPRPLHDPESDPPRRRRGRRTGLWVVGCLLLLALLLGQVAFWERDRLLAEPTVRQLLNQVCARVGCVVPLRRDLDQVRLVNRDIRPHPSVEGALIINATLHNEADFPQPYPAVEIRLSDLQGDLVAGRRFEPETYLEEDLDTSGGIGPGTMLPLVFEVVDPGDDAVAFEFVFR